MNDNIENITVRGGFSKSGEEEPIRKLEIGKGEILALVGPTGSGKSMLLADIEQLAEGDTPSGRTILVNGVSQNEWRSGIIAYLSQTMNFVIDMTVGDFLELHASSRGIGSSSIVNEVIELVNSLTGEPINAEDNITTLSGGQSRSLMIADIALISNSPIVLIDEIENAGIDKMRALEMLSSRGKIVITASHDPLIILMARRRIVMQNGGMSKILETDLKENELLHELIVLDKRISIVRDSLRIGIAIETTREKEEAYR